MLNGNFWGSKWGNVEQSANPKKTTIKRRNNTPKRANDQSHNKGALPVHSSNDKATGNRRLNVRPTCGNLRAGQQLKTGGIVWRFVVGSFPKTKEKQRRNKETTHRRNRPLTGGQQADNHTTTQAEHRRTTHILNATKTAGITTEKQRTGNPYSEGTARGDGNPRTTDEQRRNLSYYTAQGNQ